MLPALLSLPESAATEADDPAWRNFLHGLGEPALIAANAEHPDANTAFRPLPPISYWRINPAKFLLGFRLFHESRLSSGNGIACVTCHAGALSGADRRRVSIGVGGAAGKLNALSVFNAAFNFRQFWDGRAVTLEDQALLPIETEFEMNNSLHVVSEFLNADSAYNKQFAEVYPDGVSIANMADAMAHYQSSSFIRLDTPFQDYLSGNENALSTLEKNGLQRFEELGCDSCHNGINLGGNSYQKLGFVVPYYGASDDNESAVSASIDDAGLAQRTSRQNDRYVFRVPGLHGVATTPPYFHDGSISTLEEAIRLMGKHQLGIRLSESDVDAIGAFLRSLGGHFNSSREGLPITIADIELESSRWLLDSGSENIELRNDEHALAFRNILDSAERTPKRIEEELEKLVSGQVAHFDFIQFQHLELIRYSRALIHPPSSLPASQQTRLSDEAEILNKQVMALELNISDFIQAYTLTQTLENLPRQGSDVTLLSNQEVESRLSAARRQLQRAQSEIKTLTQDQVAQIELLQSILQ